MGKGVGRKDPCPCGSGQKYGDCCIGKPARPGASAAGSTDTTLPNLFETYDELTTLALELNSAPDVPMIAEPMMEFMRAVTTATPGRIDARRVFVVDFLLSARVPVGPRHAAFLDRLRDTLPDGPRALLDAFRASRLDLWRFYGDDSAVPVAGYDGAPVALDGSWGEPHPWVAGWRVDWAGQTFLCGFVPVIDSLARQAEREWEGWLDTLDDGDDPLRDAEWFESLLVEAIFRPDYGSLYDAYGQVRDRLYGPDDTDKDPGDGEWAGYYQALGYLELLDLLKDPVLLSSNGEAPFGETREQFIDLVALAVKERGADTVDTMLARHGLTRDGTWNFEVPSPAQFPVAVLGLPAQSLEVLGLTARSPLTALDARCNGMEPEARDARVALAGWVARNRWLGLTRRRPGRRVAYTEVRKAIDTLFPALRSLACASLPIPSGAWKRLVRGWKSGGLDVPGTVADLPERHQVLRSLEGVGRASVDELAQALLQAFDEAHGAGASVGSAAQVESAREQIDDGLAELARLFDK